MLGISLIGPPASAASNIADGASCALDTGGALFNGQTGVVVRGQCVRRDSVSPGGEPQYESRNIGCMTDGTGVRNDSTVADTKCDSAVPRCKLLTDGGQTGDHPIAAYETQTREIGSTGWQNLSFWCPHSAAPTPVPTAGDIRDQAIRLLPHVHIKTTAPNTLVNIQTIYWADTATHRDLGTVTVVGQPVQLKIAFDHADWNFGDGHSDRTSTPGTAYDKSANPCDTKQCSGYYGHTYTTTGHLNASVQISWNATYSLDGGAHWASVGPPLTGPTETVPIRVRQTHVVLVAPDAAGN